MQFHWPSGEQPEPTASARRTIPPWSDSDASEKVARVNIKKKSMMKRRVDVQVLILHGMVGDDMRGDLPKPTLRRQGRFFDASEAT
jgi:hypothetical protein